jgi:outer membrane autotransporter protein
MQASVFGLSSGPRNPRKTKLLAGGACAALAVAGWLPSPAESAALSVSAGASVVNNTAITAGPGTGAANANTGALMSNGGTLTNNSTITGGAPGTELSGGIGASITGTPTVLGALINTETGVIQGANTTGKTGGAGVALTGAVGLSSLDNRGVIRGGSDLTGVQSGGYGVAVKASRSSITNSGTIEGGNGAVAINVSANFTNYLIVNSGTISAGTGQAVAIEMPSGPTGSGILELHAGSTINGAVTASVGGANDILRLGGTADAMFDVSTVGPQYQNFDIFQKTGTSTWTLTGTGTAATPWNIQQGTLQIGNGGTSGSIVGNVTNSGVLAFNRSDSLTHNGAISGTGSVSQVGTGLTILTAANSYTGGTAINAGVLQVSSDANLGGAAGGLSFNGGALQATAAFSTARAVTLNAGGTLQTDADLTLSGVVSGAGGLTKTGAAALILSGANSYAGGTAINGGVLRVSSDANLGAAVGGLSFNSGVLQNTAAFSTARAATLNAGGGTLQTDADLTLSGVAAGGGRLTKTGTAALILTGANSYTGGTTISAGTLQLGAGGTTGSITGNIANSGVLAFNRSDTMSFAGLISGSGAVEQRGSGTTVLTADNSFTGGVTVSAGTLQLGNGGTTGSIVGDVANNGALAFNRSNALVLGGVISGSGSVSQVGSGTTTLTGTNSYTGGTTIAAGTLQLGNGGTTGSIVGDVADNGVLVFNRSNALTFGGAVSGAGSVEQRGAGKTTLGGANSYAGGTAIFAGTLSVAQDANLGAASGGLSFNGGTLQNTGAFASGRSVTLNAGGGSLQTDANLTLSGVAGGSGGLTKLGSAALILTGANTYSGGTVVQAGTLQIGAGGAAGSITGDVVDNGTLAFNRSDAVGFGGTISGAGSVSQVGSGMTTLLAANSYSGGTTLSAGTLRGSATSFGSGAIADNAALVIDQASDASFANAISGTGSFTKTGAGRLNYTGAGGLTGATTVAAGTLAVNGSLAQSAVEVRSGASLGGNGTVGATIIRAGGSATPGNSIGALHVNGAFVQEAGSTYQVEVDPNSNASDLIAVAGTATLAPGALLNVTKNPPGNYRVGASYHVLSATGGLAGTYALTGETAAVSAFLGLKASYDPNNAYLTVTQIADPAEVVETPNQGAVVGGLPGTPVETPVLNTQSPTEARNVLDQLSGDGHAAAKGVLVNDSRLVRDLAVDRLRDILCAEGPARSGSEEGACPNQPGRAALWGQAFGAWGSTRGQAGTGNVHRSTGGFLLGLDLPVAQFARLGWFAGYSRSDLGLHARTGNADVDAYHLGAYGGTQKGRLGVRFGAAYSWQEIGTTRTVVLPGVSNYLRADYDAGAAQAFAEAGYRLDFGRAAVEPFLDAAYVSVKTSAFSERGGVAALSARSDENHNGFATLGVRPSASLAIGSAKATFRGMVGWRHAFGEVTPTQTVAFAGGPDFVVQGAAIARDAGVLELGADVRIGGSGTLGLTYGGQYSDRVVDQSVRGQLTFRF